MKTATRIQNPESGIQYSAPGDRGCAFAARPSLPRAPRAFSLIELLVVIGVIVLLAGLTFPIMDSIKRAQTIHRARGELTQIESAIELYKTKLGFYPPDNPLNPPNWTINQLYYELLGTRIIPISGQPWYETLDGSARIRNTTAAFQAAFLNTTQVTGFMNCAKAGAGDDAPNAVKFLAGLRPGQFLEVNTPVASTVLGSAVAGVPVFTGPTGEITPFGYNSSSPKHNPKSFDLWIDIVAGGKTNRISNWSEKAIIVYWTSPANAYQ
jgi:prepilin-type N-terminal cleavage/methylation domain-containing protein